MKDYSARAAVVALLTCAILSASGCERNNAGIYDPDAGLAVTPAREAEDLPKVETLPPVAEPNADFSFDETNTRLTIDASERPFIGFLTPEDQERARKVKVIRCRGRLTNSGLLSISLCRDMREWLWTEAVVPNDAKGTFLMVAAFRQLSKLRLSGLHADDGSFPLDALRGASQAENLTELDLSSSAVSVKELGEVDWREGFPSLYSLNLYHTSVGDAGVLDILPLATRLESLNLDDAGITPASADAIARFTKLTFLHVGRSELDDESVAKFSALSNLTKLHITRTRATEAGADRLREALPNCTVVSQPEN